MRAYAEETSAKLGAVAQPLRAALTGRSTSPGIFDVSTVLGREESLGRIADRTEESQRAPVNRATLDAKLKTRMLAEKPTGRERLSEGGDEVIRPAFHHINIKTTRLADMIDWYVTVLGGKVNFRAPIAAFLTNDRANHRIALLSVPGLQDHPEKNSHTGLHHTAFEYPTFGDLMSSYARLKANGIEPQVCIDHGLTTSLYYPDPDGNLVELQADNFGDWEKSSEWMRTSEEFVRDPIGAFFDPDLVLAAHRAGTPFEVLHKDVRAGKYPSPKPPALNLPG